MPVSMLVRCEKCGYENFPQHRFCGMCAAELRLPGPPGAGPPGAQPSPPRRPDYPSPPLAASTPSRTIAPEPISGPSFLGLANESSGTRSLSYLLEDESPTHWGRNLILILLLAAIAGAAWHWRQDVRDVTARFLNRPSSAASTTNSGQEANSSQTPASASPSPVAPAPAGSSDSHVDQPGSAAGDQSLAQGQNPTSAIPAGATPNPATEPAHSQSSDQRTGVSQDGGTSALSESAPPPESNPVGNPPAPAEKLASIPAEVTKASRSQAQRVNPSTTAGEYLEADGEKYLYGNGAPEDCARARKNLLAAAQRSNAKAQNVLGAMYATGHCATRDLPTSYRWFARSLRQDPGNTRIEQDLKVLWNQMTPGERQLALRDAR
jgi:hypothetical protein